MNTNSHPSDMTAPAPDEHGRCLCHGEHACPSQAAVTIPAGDLAAMAGLLATLDGFLRSDHAVTAALSEYLARPAPGPDEAGIGSGYLPHQARYEANVLIDQLGLTAARAARLGQQHQPPEQLAEGGQPR